MSGQATGWVLRHGPHPEGLDRHGTPYGNRARGLRSVLLAVADAANIDGEYAHPGVENVAAMALYSRRQTIHLLAELVDDGWLAVDAEGGRGHGGRGLATVYSLPMMDSMKGAASAPFLDERVQSDTRKGAVQHAKGCSPDAKGCSPDCTPTVSLTVETNGLEHNARASTQLALVASPGFDEFWSVYPARKGKVTARKAWANAVKRAAPEVIIAGARAYAEDPRRDAEHTKWPQGWLNDDRWEDEPVVAPPKSAVPKRLEGLASWLDATSPEQAAGELGGGS